MLHCHFCAAEQSEASKFCSECGAALKTEYAATATYGANAVANDNSVHSSPSNSSHHGQFLPGAKVANRYRIVSLVGKGGMGEVYRADDLKLGHTVALKFLPNDLARDPQRLEYFHSEVRLTRQISHPNVCRVYDIGEVDGQHFLSMEYIDGEDLKILLRRIGRLPKDKGVEIAQQLCAGLSAAHDKGVLHRDLKPANVMIDGRGHVRITDFGLARLSTEARTGDVAGTPAYMAPEQLAHGEATIQSDLYSLGLILYELFTGVAVHKRMSIPELLRAHEQSAPSLPSQLIDDMDGAVEKVILRCLKKEPNERPNSARAVAAALPGGDPLAAAIIAGETPSPEMVAAAGGSGVISPRTAIACLVTVVTGLLLYVPIAGQLSPSRDLKDGVDFFAKDARDILQEQGYYDPESPPAHVVYGFRGMRNAEFWYRQSPIPMTPHEISLHGLPSPNVVTLDNPPLNIENMISLRLTSSGTLQEFAVVPGVDRAGKTATGPLDWKGSTKPLLEKAFERAGLRIEDYDEPQSPARNPPFYADVMWEYHSSAKESNALRVDVATLDGRIVYFHVVGPDAEPSLLTDRVPRNPQWNWVLWSNASLVIAIAALVLAWFNASRRRCDWTGAWRVGLAVFMFDLVASILELDHHLLHARHEASLLWTALISASSRGVRWWIYYLAMEPFARRLWPNVLTSWSRGMSGRLRDPLLGRDLLYGAVVAVLTSVVMVAIQFIAMRWFNTRDIGVTGFEFNLANLSGTRYQLGGVARWLDVGVSAVYWAFWLVLLRSLLRLEWLTVIVFVAINGLMRVGLSTPIGYIYLLHFAALAILITRVGVVAAGSFMFCQFLLIKTPMTSDLYGPDVATSLFAVAVVVVCAGYGFSVSFERGKQTQPVFDEHDR